MNENTKNYGKEKNILNEAQQQLQYVASVSNFRSSSIDSFRLALLQSLHNVVEASAATSNCNNNSSNSRGICKYNALYLRECLSKNIDWKSICKYHDSLSFSPPLSVAKAPKATPNNNQEIIVASASASSSSPSTPLDEILLFFMNPRMIPLSCYNILLLTMLDALLKSSSNLQSKQSIESALPVPWSPSQKLLLSTIVKIINQCPSVRIESPINSYYNQHIDNPHSLLRLLMACYTLANDCKSQIFQLFSCVLHLIQLLDDKDIQLLMQQQEKEQTGNSYLKSNNNNGDDEGDDDQRPKKKARFYSMRSIHDCEDINSKQNFRQFSQRDPDIISLRNMVTDNSQSLQQSKSASAATTNSATLLQSTFTKTTRTLLTRTALFVRARAYEILVSIFVNNWCPGFKGKIDVESQLMQSILWSACRVPSSPSLRVCLLSVVDTMKNGYAIVMNKLWKCYLGSQDEIYLRFVSEWIVECSYFDNREKCWSALQPLIRLCNMQQQAMAETEAASTANNILPPQVFRCVAYILSRRHRIFLSKNDSIRVEYRQFITQLSMSYGSSPNCWIDAAIPSLPSERQRIIHTLQGVGIVGLSEDVDSAEKQLEQQQQQSPMSVRYATALECWPYSKLYSMRLASERMGKRNDGNSFARKLLSPLDHDASIQIYVEPSLVTQNKNDNNNKSSSYGNGSTTTQLQEFCTFDLLYEVFQYLGCRRLARMREVCREWRQVAEVDKLWHALYGRTFGFRSFDPNTAYYPNDKSHWREIVIQKYLVEKQVRYKFSKDGFRYCGCDVVGCKTILRTKSQHDRHYQIHEKEDESRRLKLRYYKPRHEYSKQRRKVLLKSTKKATKTKDKKKIPSPKKDNSSSLSKSTAASSSSNKVTTQQYAKLQSPSPSKRVSTMPMVGPNNDAVNNNHNNIMTAMAYHHQSPVGVGGGSGGFINSNNPGYNSTTIQSTQNSYNNNNNNNDSNDNMDNNYQQMIMTPNGNSASNYSVVGSSVPFSPVGPNNNTNNNNIDNSNQQQQQHQQQQQEQQYFGSPLPVGQPIVINGQLYYPMPIPYPHTPQTPPQQQQQHE